MEEAKQLIQEAIDTGFSQAGELNVSALVFMPEVREMCAADKCHAYGRSWVCPPACGSIEEVSARASQYSRGILVQTIGRMEDDFDYETIVETQKKHAVNFRKLIVRLRERYDDLLPMTAGGCDLCRTCTYPDAPCRHPEEAMTSMEAYGLFVSRVCEASGIPYNNGPQTITYTSCYLLKA